MDEIIAMYAEGPPWLLSLTAYYLEGGETLDEFLEQYPGVSRETAIAALEEAKALVLARFGK